MDLLGNSTTDKKFNSKYCLYGTIVYIVVISTLSILGYFLNLSLIEPITNYFNNPTKGILVLINSGLLLVLHFFCFVSVKRKFIYRIHYVIISLGVTLMGVFICYGIYSLLFSLSSSDLSLTLDPSVLLETDNLSIFFLALAPFALTNFGLSTIIYLLNNKNDYSNFQNYKIKFLKTLQSLSGNEDKKSLCTKLGYEIAYLNNAYAELIKNSDSSFDFNSINVKDKFRKNIKIVKDYLFEIKANNCHNIGKFVDLIKKKVDEENEFVLAAIIELDK